MSRTIKFRAWIRDAKKMVYDDDQDEFLTYQNGKWWVDFESAYPNHELVAGEDHEIPNWEQTEDIDLMQFTGLSDKNGKEIYEWDVFPSAKGNWVVKFGAWDYWTGKNLTPMYGWYGECQTLEGKSHGQLPLTHISTGEHVEVIGNIYENTELLTTNPE